jgi:multidrug efflux pump subunit AcrA (membrane-fusion protein)
MGFRFRAAPKKIEQGLYAPAKYKFPKWRWYLLTITIASPALYILGKWLLNSLLTSAPGYMTTDILTIRAPNDGYVSVLSVNLGDKMAVDASMLSLNSPITVSQKDYLISELQHLRTMREHALNNPEIPNLLKMQKAARQQVAENQAYYQKLLKYQKTGLITAIDLSNFGNSYHNSEINLEQVNAKIAKSQQDYKDYLEKTYDQPMREIIEQLNQMQIQNNLLQIKAPSSGTIINILIQPNEFVEKGQALLKLATGTHFYVQAFFDPSNLNKLIPGHKVYILLPDYSLLTGVIREQPDFTSTTSIDKFNLPSFNHDLVTLIDVMAPIPQKYRIQQLKVRVIL